jgi:hypothetical protein
MIVGERGARFVGAEARAEAANEDSKGQPLNAIISEAEGLRRDLRRRRPQALVRGVVVTYPVGHAAVHDVHDDTSPDCHRGSLHEGHMACTRRELARRLAALKGFAFGGDYDALRHAGATAYFVPSDTLDAATALLAGIRGEDDLFGGVVPFAFVATKTITHPLPDSASRAPHGWSVEFPRRVAGVVLEGRSAFTREDARTAGRELLQAGPVRVKPGGGIAGLGQSVVETMSQLDQALDALDPAEVAQRGVVVEENLSAVTTYSIGQVRVADLSGTYFGTQYTTTNNHGAEVYGGSEITVVRGGFEAFRRCCELPEAVALAIEQARIYDAAASECFEGLYASRRNYDVVRGNDRAGRAKSGVLEQSWRLGGASGAEIGALEAFRADPSLRIVRATTREVYGDTPEVPAGAVVYFSGVDDQVGRLTKFALTETYADAR